MNEMSVSRTEPYRRPCCCCALVVAMLGETMTTMTTMTIHVASDSRTGTVTVLWLTLCFRHQRCRPQSLEAISSLLSLSL